MLVRNIFFFLIFLFLACEASAWDVRTTMTEQDNILGVSGEMSSFSLAGGNINGQGLRLDFSHSFQKSWAAEVFLSTALTTSGASSFTGYGGYAFYDLYSSGRNRNQQTAIDGIPLIQDSQEQTQLVQIGAGVNQYLLNGSRGVYSSSGLGVAANYIFRMFKYNFKASARYSSLTSNNVAVQAMSFSLGVVFPL